VKGENKTFNSGKEWSCGTSEKSKTFKVRMEGTLCVGENLSNKIRGMVAYAIHCNGVLVTWSCIQANIQGLKSLIAQQSLPCSLTWLCQFKYEKGYITRTCCVSAVLKG